MTDYPQINSACQSILLLILSLTSTTATLALENTDLQSGNELSLTERALPPLGNTVEQDRFMLREISDLHIHSTTDQLTSSGRVTVNDHQSLPVPNNASAKAPSVWEFVAQSKRLTIPEHELVSSYTEQYKREARWISRILQRASPFAGHIVDALDEQYLPVELALLPAIESGFQPDVISPQLAAGLWQIVPATASEIGISSSVWFDGRSDIRTSTTAAIKYLGFLNAEFHGDWLLTLAAYNAGLGRVHSAIKRNQQRNLPTDFWSLKLPRETRHYVPKFLALVNMLRHERLPEFEIPVLARGSAFDIIDVGQRISVDQLARLTGVSEHKLQNLNAALKHNITPPDGPHIIYVPPGHGIPLIDELSKRGNTRLFTTSTTHRVVAGDTVSSIARTYGVSQKQLIEMNDLTGSLIKIGQELKLVTHQSGNDSRIEYVVTIGDTLSDIANRFSVNLSDIRNAAGESLASDIIHPGERLSLFTHNISK